MTCHTCKTQTAPLFERDGKFYCAIDVLALPSGNCYCVCHSPLSSAVGCEHCPKMEPRPPMTEEEVIRILYDAGVRTAEQFDELIKALEEEESRGRAS